MDTLKNMFSAVEKKKLAAYNEPKPVVASNEPKPEEASNEPKPVEVVKVTYTIGGVKVEFPAKAYPSQISMMDKIIRGCHRAQNCLLESPTGSGKTLALLCGALAWQRAEANRLDEAYRKEIAEYQIKEREWKLKNEEIMKKMSEVIANQNPGIENIIIPDDISEQPMNVEDVEIINLDSEPEDDVFRPPTMKKVKKESSTPSTSLDHAAPVAQDGDSTIPPEIKNIDLKIDKVPGMPSIPKQPRVPQVYFGTRTHKQVAQVVHELRRTAYNDVNMTILSSRTHSCIMVDKYFNYKSKDDMCSNLLDPRSGMGCRYKNNVKNYRHHDMIPKAELPSVWDIEDLIHFGKRKMSCPYFLARELRPSSSIIFCPYNYLIDPLIRKSLDIKLKGDILILDEAHNIEDTCREAASFTVDQKAIQDAMKDCEEVANQSDSPEPFKTILQVFQSLSLWIDQHKNDVNEITDYDQGKVTYFGPEAVKKFDGYEFGKNSFRNLETALKEIESYKGENEDAVSILGPTKYLAEGLILILSFLYNEKYTCDYHVALTKNFSHHFLEEPSRENDGFLNRRKKPKSATGWQYSLHFWCLNPSTIFDDIKEAARTIVLTSGTLSPMDSFQSELGVTFPITLEANHVIDASQCWVGSLGMGPSRVMLDGTYKSTSTYQFQDEVGQIMLQICSYIPHGVLCFVPSYTLLEKLRDRWSFIGLTERIEQHKDVVWEPRRGDELQNILMHFYQRIDETSSTNPGRGVTGVLFLAVCRGKVSEGLDFADKNARIVITIGIPFPNVKDAQVMLKKSYNDKHQHSKGLLSGRDWYQIQAYRALNQALGRCIRHRKDWGAILLLDSRFSSDTYYKGLSKWLRNKVRHHFQFSEMMEQLSEFIQTRLKIEQTEESSRVS